jgi:hypothetical protein
VEEVLRAILSGDETKAALLHDFLDGTSHGWSLLILLGLLTTRGSVEKEGDHERLPPDLSG